jgi:hypothetical protein
VVEPLFGEKRRSSVRRRQEETKPARVIDDSIEQTTGPLSMHVKLLLYMRFSLHLPTIVRAIFRTDAQSEQHPRPTAWSEASPSADVLCQ